uniref:Moesin/ezrin/radixin homolog 1 n=1 Tax=Elaeophora elaphi TaxID=1147741 RepID=A0A0R3RHF2_9BILA
MDQQPATVQFLDSTKHIFYVSKKAEGSELFDKVCAFLGLTEKDYFALSFVDSDGNQQWIYDDKRISKQLKGHSWNFNFKVKFYPPEPATLAEDRTRHLLSLQVRHDIFTGKLPATLATHALLGSYVAQSVRGDYEPSLQYIDFLRSCYLAPMPNETLYEKVEELHKHHKGETSAEADLHYLENAKKLSMYGVRLFHAKDGKGTPVQIGISAHGINVYLDQIRVHRFLWQNIIKIGYRRNIFMIKVKPGELEKNESTAAFKLPDYEAAKRVWKCGVEHHTFFRLIQPEEKPHKGLFRWGSARFRYQGRTQFQSKMASQMFCNNQPVQRSQSVRLTQNDGNVSVPVSMSHTLPLMHSESGTGRELEWSSSQTISSEKIYSTNVTEVTQNRESNAMPNGAEVGNTNNTSGKPLGSIHSSAIFTNSVTTATTTTTTTNSAATITITAIPITTITSTSTTVTEYFEQPLSPHVSSHSVKITQGPPMNEFSDGDFYGEPHHVSNNLCESKPDIPTLQRENGAEFLPVEDKAVVYHPGYYEEEVSGSRSRLPPVEPGDDFVLVHGPKMGSAGKIFHQNGAETDILVKEEDIETYPIHRNADIYHSGFSRSITKKDAKGFENEKYLKTNDAVDKPRKNIRQTVDKEKYPTNEKFEGPVSHTERSMELPAESLRAHANVYNQGYYDTVDPGRTDIDEKGNMRNWFRCYKKSEKSPTKKEKNAEAKRKTEKNASKQVSDDHTVGESGSVNDEGNNTNKIALIHVKQPGYERQIVEASYYNVESSDKELERAADVKGSKLIINEIEADKSFGSDLKEGAHDSTQLKQTCHLSLSGTDSCHVRPGAYGMPSTSYDELLHNFKLEKELPSVPIHEYVAVYHPGISFIKDRKRRKFLIRKERQKTTSSETSTDEEVQTDKGKKGKAVLDISGADRNDLTNVDVEKKPIDKEIGRRHMTTDGKGYLDQVKVDRITNSEMQKSAHKMKDKKHIKSFDEQNLKSESTCQKVKAMLHLNEDQSKPSNMKKEAALGKAESKDVEYKVLPTVEKSKSTELLEPSRNIQNLDDTPPPVKLSRVTEISFQPLHLAVKIQNQIRNASRNYRTFKRSKHGGAVEFVAKENINPESYKLEYAPYKGPLEVTNFVKGLQFVPIHEYSAVYHPGNSYVKSRKVNKQRDASEIQNEEKSDTLKAEEVAALHLNAINSDAKHHQEEKTDSFLTKNKDQATTYAAKIVCKTPADEKREVRKHPFKYRKISGDVEIVEKSFVKPETYNLTTIPYDGPMSCLEYEKELSFTPLRECAAVYHSEIFYKTRRLHGSSTESISSFDSTTGSSSTSSADLSEKYKERKKVMLYVSSRSKHDSNDAIAESPKRKGILTFWRKATRSEKTGVLDGKKEKLEVSPKSQLMQQQPELSAEFTADQVTSSPSQMVSTVLVKNFVEEPSSNLHVKSENRKMNAKLYVKNEPSTASEYIEDNGNRGKFDLFHFWRLTDKLNSKKYNLVSADTDSSREEGSVQLTTKDSKKPINYVTNTDMSTNVKANELAPSVDIKEESLNHISLSSSGQNRANVETKKNAIIYLKRDSDFSDGCLPLNLNSSGISKQAAAMNTISSHTSSKTNEGGKSGDTEGSQLVDKSVTVLVQNVDDSSGSNLKKCDNNDDVEYVSKIKVKRKMRNAGKDSQQDSNVKAKETIASSDGISKKSSFVVKGFHLRGPPCDSEEEIAIHSSSKYQREKNAHITEAAETGEVTITELKKADFTDNNDKPMLCEELTVNKFPENDIFLKENKKDGKSSRGGFFSSLWRGSKSKNSDQDEHQKQEKLTEKSVHGDESTIVGRTSPADELGCNILRTKIILDSFGSSSNVTQNGEQTKDFIPVYDFSYVPNFSVVVENMEMVATTTAGDVTEQIGLVAVQDIPGAKQENGVINGEVINETEEQKGSKLKQLFNHRLDDISASTEDQSESWTHEQSAVMGKRALIENTFVSELTWEKMDADTERQKGQYTEPEIPEAGKLFYRSGISSGETSDEPYKFTQTPPDVLVLVAHPTDSKSPGGFVEQIKRQVTQVVTKASPSSDIKKKLKKEKKLSKTGASPRGSESSNASELEVAPHYDSLSFNQSKKRANKPEVIGKLPFDDAKLDDGHMLLKKPKEGIYDSKNAEAVLATHPADIS